MFDRLRKAFQRGTREREGPASTQSPPDPVSEWAASRGMSFSMAPLGHTAMMQGEVGGHPWRMELGKPNRDYIAGEELRARAELDLFDELGAMIINRPLKDALERRAYSMITDTLQTTADARLPEEMRWLAMYDEIGWEDAPPRFWDSYAVLAGRREHALAWVDGALIDLILGWPAPAPGPQVPFLVSLVRGKCYLRMQYQPAVTSTLDHATQVFTAACESALGAFRR